MELGWGKVLLVKDGELHALGWPNVRTMARPGRKVEVWVPVGPHLLVGALGLWGRDRGALGARPLLVAQRPAPCRRCPVAVRCPWHGARFNVSTGDLGGLPGLDSLHKFQVGDWRAAGRAPGVQGPEHPKAWA